MNEDLLLSTIEGRQLVRRREQIEAAIQGFFRFHSSTDINPPREWLEELVETNKKLMSWGKDPRRVMTVLLK
jgi:hypothetical protein